MVAVQWLHAWVWLLFFLPAAGFPHHKHQVLRMDEASLTVYNELDSEVLVSWMSERCYQVGLTHTYCMTCFQMMVMMF